MPTLVPSSGELDKGALSMICVHWGLDDREKKLSEEDREFWDTLKL